MKRTETFDILMVQEKPKGVCHMKIGYVRVSTKEQNTARQEVLMEELGVEKMFIDRASGKDTARPELNRMMKFVRAEDVVICESISRFARNTKDLLELIDTLSKRGAAFVSKKEAIDTTSPTGMFMLTIFGAMAQLERAYILERQAEGIAIAKQAGAYKGRKKIVNEKFGKVYQEWKAERITAVRAMELLGMKPNTFYRRVAEHEKPVAI
jgi:DNA invertase Pin-like site-specific DNA recombinase